MEAVLERRKKSSGLKVVAEYDATADDKRRISLRGSKGKHFHVRVLSDGSVLLQPQILVPRSSISPRTLKMLDAAAENFKKGLVSSPIDLTPFQEG